MRTSRFIKQALQALTLSILLSTTTGFQGFCRDLDLERTYDEIDATTDLVWYPCYEKFYCAKLDVPLDYSIPNGTHRAAVPLIKVPAEDNSPNGAYQGMVLMNPGGPGGPGVDSILSDHSALQSVIGTNFDIVAFDPRGIGRSNPLANCSNSSFPNEKLRVASIPYDPELPYRKYFEDKLQDAKVLGQKCEAAIGGSEGAGQHMSTAVVARDILSIVDAFSATDLGKAVANSSLLNFWGFSYGTIIGQTFASLYPDRVGRVVLDGVMNPESYHSGTETPGWEHADALIDTFLSTATSPVSDVPFFTGTSPLAIRARFQNLVTLLNSSYDRSQDWIDGTPNVKYLAAFKKLVRSNLYSPITDFPKLAYDLNLLDSFIKNVTIKGVGYSKIPKFDKMDKAWMLDTWTAAVWCSDSPFSYNKTYADMEAYIEQLKLQTFLWEDFAWIQVTCTGWPVKARWRYNGTFGGETKNPILFVSNSFDPATPIENSLKWAPMFKDAQVLEIQAIGHTSSSVRNACADDKIRTFFQTGVLSSTRKYTVCEMEKGPWGIQLEWSSLKNLLNDLRASSNTSSTPIEEDATGISNILTTRVVKGLQNATGVTTGVTSMALSWTTLLTSRVASLEPSWDALFDVRVASLEPSWDALFDVRVIVGVLLLFFWELFLGGCFVVILSLALVSSMEACSGCVVHN